MPEGITPAELARELGISPKTLRAWLRAQGWQAVPHARWHLSEQQADKATQHFTAGD